MSNHTSYGVGGRVNAYIRPKNKPELIQIIKLIHKNKTFNRNKIKDKFIKENFVKKRLQENLNSKIIFKEKNQLKLTKIGYLIINFFNKISKIFKLKSDVR